MKNYRASIGSPLSKAKAQVYGEFIESLADELGGVRPETILNVAKGSPVEDWFEWDNDKAANTHRERQASDLLQFIEVEIVKEGQSHWTRAFRPVTVTVLRKPDDEKAEPPKEISVRVYKPIEIILQHPQEREEVLRDIIKRFQDMRNKYAEFQELKEIFEAIDKMVKV